MPELPGLETIEIKVKGKRVACTQSGSGSDVIILHGWLVNRHCFNKAVPYLAQRHRVTTFDVPGHGDSGALDGEHNMRSLVESTIGVMNVLGIEKAIVGGHSMGGGIAIQTALECPEKVSRLVLCAPFVNMMEDATILQRALYFLASKTPSVRDYFYNLMKKKPDQFWSVLFGKSVDLSDPTLLPIIASSKRSDQRALWESIQMIMSINLADNLPKIKTPVKIFVGQEDRQFRRQAEMIAGRVANSQLVVIDDHDHFLPVKNPKLFAQQFED